MRSFLFTSGKSYSILWNKISISDNRKLQIGKQKSNHGWKGSAEMREKQLLSHVGENGGKGNLKQASNSRGHLKHVYFHVPNRY